MAKLSGGDKLEAFLADLSRKVGKGGTLCVGFLEGATYPSKPTKELRAQYAKRRAKGNQKPVNGASGGQTLNVATVAAFNEFGTGTSPPRPFFRNMIEAKKDQWGPALAGLLKANDFDVDKSLAQLGEAVTGQLKQSIIDTNEPPLAQSTIKRKGFSKVLIDTSHMLASTDYEVVKK